MARKTGKELRKEYRDILDKTKAMQKRLIKRAEELVEQYPDVRYGEMTVGAYKKYFKITPSIALRIIELVEEHIVNKHPHQQGKLFVLDMSGSTIPSMPSISEAEKRAIQTLAEWEKEIENE